MASATKVAQKPTPAKRAAETPWAAEAVAKCWKRGGKRRDEGKGR